MSDPRREAIVAAIKYFTEDPDRCDMQWREGEVADEVLRRLNAVEAEHRVALVRSYRVAGQHGEGDSEVWIPPRHDCMERRPDKPCPHCSGLMFHHRTRRCGDCGRRP